MAAVSPREFTARPAQLDTFNALAGARFGLCNGPTGSGKSVSILMLANAHRVRYPNGSVIIAVPQISIAANFQRSLRMRWGADSPAVVDVRGATYVSGASQLARAAKSPGVYVTTQQTLALSLSETHWRESLLVIDEAHHLSDVEGDNANRLGEAVRGFLAEPTNRLHAFTATPFRTDRIELFGPLFNAERASYTLSIDEHLRQNTNIQHIDCDPLTCRDLMGALLSYMKHDGRDMTSVRDIVWFPAANSVEAFPDKYRAVRRYLRGLMKLYGLTQHDHNGAGVHTLSNGKRRFVVLDLVDDRLDRQANGDAHRKLLDGDRINVVLALNLAREGFDWPAADRGFVMGARSSELQAVQMLGRLLRGTPTKTRVQFFQMIQKQDTTAENFREQLRAYIFAIVLTLIVQDAVPSPDRGALKDKREPVTEQTIHSAFELAQEATDTLVRLQVQHDGDMSAVRPAFIEAFKDTGKADELFDRMTANRTRAFEQNATGAIIVREDSISDSVIRYAMESYNVERLSELRSRYGKNFAVVRDECFAWCVAEKVTSNWKYKEVPAEFPSDPLQVYGLDWYERVRTALGIAEKDFDSVRDECFAWCVANRITNGKKYQTNSERPESFPARPEKMYEAAWFSLVREELGVASGFSAVRDECFAWCVANEITNGDRYFTWPERPESFPAAPNAIYNEPDWFKKVRQALGKDTGFLQVRDACFEWCVANEVTGRTAFRKSKPPEFPLDPNAVYKDPDWWQKVREAIATVTAA